MVWTSPEYPIVGNGNGHVRTALRDEPALTTAARSSVHQQPERVSVVIPTKNEGANIAWVLERLPPGIDEVVIVDACSTDDTVAVARSVRPDAVIVEEPRPGKGVALRVGFRVATGDLVVMLDADGSMDPGEIPRYLSMLSNGFDFVKGSRFIAGGDSTDITLVRQLGNRVFVGFVNRIYHGHFTDLCYGYCAFRRSFLHDLALFAGGFEIETQLNIHALKAGLRVCEVPTNETARHAGESNLRTFRDGQRVLRTIISEWLAPHDRWDPPVDDVTIDLAHLDA